MRTQLFKSCCITPLWITSEWIHFPSYTVYTEIWRIYSIWKSRVRFGPTLQITNLSNTSHTTPSTQITKSMNSTSTSAQGASQTLEAAFHTAYLQHTYFRFGSSWQHRYSSFFSMGAGTHARTHTEPVFNWAIQLLRVGWQTVPQAYRGDLKLALPSSTYSRPYPH